MNCGRCAICGTWCTDRERPGTILQISYGARVEGKLLCDEHLPEGHRSHSRALTRARASRLRALAASRVNGNQAPDGVAADTLHGATGSGRACPAHRRRRRRRSHPGDRRGQNAERAARRAPMVPRALSAAAVAQRGPHLGDAELRRLGGGAPASPERLHRAGVVDTWARLTGLAKPKNVRVACRKEHQKPVRARRRRCPPQTCWWSRAARTVAAAICLGAVQVQKRQR